MELLERGKEYRDRLEYIISLPTSEIQVFGFHFVQLEARVIFNRDVKYFQAGEHEKAFYLFEDSLKVNPDNPLVYWNLARLGRLLSKGDAWIADNHRTAEGVVGDHRVGKRLADEERRVKRAGGGVGMEPVSEYTLR